MFFEISWYYTEQINRRTWRVNEWRWKDDYEWKFEYFVDKLIPKKRSKFKENSTLEVKIVRLEWNFY